MPPHMAHQRGDQITHHGTHFFGDTFIQIYSIYILIYLKIYTYAAYVICIEGAVRKCMMSKGGKIAVTIKGDR